MQLYTVSIAEIEGDIVNYFSARYGTPPAALTPATDLKKMYNFNGSAWAQMGDTLSRQPWIIHLGIKLSQNDMMTVTTVGRLAYVIFSKMQHVVAATTPAQVTPLKSLMNLSTQMGMPSSEIYPSPGTRAQSPSAQKIKNPRSNF